MVKPILSTQNLNKVYPGALEFHALYDMNIDIPVGQFVAVIGPSGSGKSTLINILSLLDRLSTGELIIDGESTSKWDEDQLAHFRNNKMGFVFQFHHLLPEFTCLENILIPYWISQGKPPPDIIDRAKQLLKTLNVDVVANNYPSQISGGQQQRVSIARSLINQPAIVFADEPTGNLDQASGAAVVELLRSMNAQFKTTLVMVTHDREIALKADRIIEVVDGHICHEFLIKEIGETKAREQLGDPSCSNVAKKEPKKKTKNKVKTKTKRS